MEKTENNSKMTFKTLLASLVPMPDMLTLTKQSAGSQYQKKSGILRWTTKETHEPFTRGRDFLQTRPADLQTFLLGWQVHQSVLISGQVDDVLRLGHSLRNVLGGLDLTQLHQTLTSLGECLKTRKGLTALTLILVIY